MNRWPGQGYEYVENVLFEKGPWGKQKKHATVQQSDRPPTKDMTAKEQELLDAEKHLDKVARRRQKEKYKKVQEKKKTSTFLSVDRSRTQDQINFRKGQIAPDQGRYEPKYDACMPRTDKVMDYDLYH